MTKREKRRSKLFGPITVVIILVIFFTLGFIFLGLIIASGSKGASIESDPAILAIVLLIFAFLLSLFTYGINQTLEEMKEKKAKNPMESVLTKEEIEEERKQEIREQEKELENKKKETEEKMELYKQVLKLAEPEKPGRQRLIQRKPPSIVSNVLIKKLAYKGEFSEEERCKICKLEIRKKQEILQCPKCQALFHKEHLVEWLETKKDCPVCHTEIRN